MKLEANMTVLCCVYTAVKIFLDQVLLDFLKLNGNFGYCASKLQVDTNFVLFEHLGFCYLLTQVSCFCNFLEVGRILQFPYHFPSSCFKMACFNLYCFSASHLF